MRRRLLAVLLAFAVVAVAGFAVPLLLSTAANRTQQFVSSRTTDAARFAVLAQENRTHLVTEVRAHTTLYGDDVVVVDARRRVVVEAGMRATDPDVAAAIDAALRNQPRQALAELRPWSGGTVLFTQAVGTGTSVSGAVVLRSSVAAAVADIRFRWAVVLLAALVAAAACVLLVLRIARWLLRPVAQLADGVHAVAAGRERTHVDVSTGPPELRGLAEQFNQMSDALAESAGRQRQLVADASHQLRNPLAALRLRIDTLAATDPAYDPVVSELDRLEALLAGMLTLASADSTATDLAASAAAARCDAATVLADRVEAWGRAADAAGVHLAGEIPVTLPVRCAEPELAQVLDVVLDNAIKYAGADATIRWTSHTTPAETTLTIDDDGPGVPEEHLARLTERFWRATTATPGSGLGLAIAERLTTAHGGRFTVGNGDRGGLAVTITLRTAR
ncbi:sensor histidine kinase [Actinophytocola algeriensis]|uniref:histidine kinase n=1 Tax=Actinophytocola algeriensis TaxID=1768010 RepID=A0A7W7Q0J2_9PSEU|nr:HAMP domain-containing sensor histidine kinase [Actinophytocola algeriensis]MBB4904654.1 signal transduction histidine kinase [Actinophytocola algeriensis]MBE1476487.1 signal transduction histidine kinase [Actinophytocola algeriensis]